MDNNATYTMRLGKELYNSFEHVLSKWITLPDGVVRFFSNEVLGNSLSRWAFSIFMFAIFFLLRKQITRLVQNILNRISSTIQSSDNIQSNVSKPLFNIIHKPLRWAILLVGFNISISSLNFEKGINTVLITLSHSFRIFLVAWVLFLAVDFLYTSSKILLKKNRNQSFYNFMNLTRKFVKIIIGVVSAIFFLDLWGYNVNGLIASLGLVGMAVALAAQDTTKNIFGALMIFADTPFKVGDWIQTPQTEGFIEEIGMRSTKVRTFEDALVSVPNGVMANASIINWSAMTKRRIKMYLGLTYSTTPEQMKNILKEMRELLQNDPDIDQKTVFVNFTDYNSSSLDIFCYFFTRSTVWGEYLNIRERINLEFMQIVHNNHASFAFPSQSLYIEKNGTRDIDV
ncbi:mechanosensitive ion channel family protein [Sulfurimonas sp. HSL-1716]|uniref:mechanosensitive ion channel family protein n=1 Tax=Hydrocurvibacter sulfurireducens TaxID=3131937 RepID=UPI0031F847B8